METPERHDGTLAGAMFKWVRAALGKYFRALNPERANHAKAGAYRVQVREKGRRKHGGACLTARPAVGSGGRELYGWRFHIRRPGHRIVVHNGKIFDSKGSEMQEIRAGDTVLLPVVMGMTVAEIAELRAELVDAFPGVTWSIQRETMITDALVYRVPEKAGNEPQVRWV